MPRLACWSCGRQVFTVDPIEALFSEERRCPRCGAYLREERRAANRRTTARRTNPVDDLASLPDGEKRREPDRRRAHRRDR
jgi:DNA-directed RNA polymerase subunit RPC12/RpoP